MSVNSQSNNSNMFSYLDITRTPTPISYLSSNKKFTFDNINLISPFSIKNKCHPDKKKYKYKTCKSKSMSDLNINSFKSTSFKLTLLKDSEETDKSVNNELLKRRGLSQIPKINV